MNQQVRAAVQKAMYGFDIATALCQIKACTGIAAWRVGASVWFPDTTEYRPDNCVNVNFQLYVCDACRVTIELRHVVDDRGWQRIARAVRQSGHSTPDRASLKLRCTPLKMARA